MHRFLIAFAILIHWAAVVGCGPASETDELAAEPPRRVTSEGCPMEYASLTKRGGSRQQYAITEGSIAGKPVLGFPDGFGTGELAGWVQYHEYQEPVTITISACTTEECVNLLRQWASASTDTTAPTFSWDYVIATPPLYLCDKIDDNIVIKSRPNEQARKTLLVGTETFGSPYSFTITGEGTIDYTIEARPVWLE